MSQGAGGPQAEGARHVMFVVNNFPPKVGGVEMHVAQLAAHLARLGVRVTVFTLDNDNPSGSEAGVEVHRLRSTAALGNVIALPLPGARRTMLDYARRERVDIIATQTRFFPMSFLGVQVARRTGLPSIHTEHGSGHVMGVPPLVAGASRLVDLTMGRYVLRRSTVVLGVSDAVSDFVRHLAGVPCRTFFNGIPVATFRRAAAADPVGEPGGRIVYVGRIVAGKGWERVLRVSERLAPEFPDVTVHFIGDGPQMDDLSRAVAGSAIRNRVRLHGFLASPQVAELLRGAVLVNPTKLAEGFQTTLLEAIAADALVVSSPVAAAVTLRRLGASVRVVTRDDDDAWISELRDAFTRGWTPTDPEIVDSFDWAARARDYLKIVADLPRATTGPTAHA